MSATEINFTITSDRIKEAIEEKDERIKIALEKVGLHLAGEAKDELENDPRRVDTGMLRNSIAYAVGGEVPSTGAYGNTGKKARTYKSDTGEKGDTYSHKVPKGAKGTESVYIGSNVSYAPYVHEGTQRMAPNRFIKNAIERNMERIKQMIESELGG